jgi:two-component system sensor histidine kinase YesM
MSNKYTVKFNDISIVRRMLIILLGTFLIPLLFVSFIVIWYIHSRESVHERTEVFAVLNNISDELKQTFLSVDDISDLIIIKGLMGRFSGYHESVRDYIMLADYADDYIRNRPSVKSVLLIRDGRIIFERGPALDSDIPPYPQDIKEAERNDKKSYWATPRKMNYFFINYYADTKILPSYKMISYPDSHSMLFLFVGFDEEELLSRYTSYNRGNFFLMREDFYILASTDKESPGNIYAAELSEHIKGERGYFSKNNNFDIAYIRSYNDWYLVNHVKKTRFNMNAIGYFIIILFAMMFGIGLTFRRLNDIMHEVYITKIYNQEAKLKMLTSQVNPHFLYNTLDSIRWKALKNKDEEVAGQIEALANMFRHILSKGNDIVTMEQEIKQLETYLFIMNFRYRNRIKCKITADDNVKQIKIPKLILQPIVENSILHGIEPRLGDGEITVNIEVRLGRLYIIISDNGCGADASEINSMLRNKEANENFFALKNIDQRIKLRYGEEYGISFNSIVGKGAIVTLIMPVESV